MKNKTRLFADYTPYENVNFETVSGLSFPLPKEDIFYMYQLCFPYLNSGKSGDTFTLSASIEGAGYLKGYDVSIPMNAMTMYHNNQFDAQDTGNLPSSVIAIGGMATMVGWLQSSHLATGIFNIRIKVKKGKTVIPNKGAFCDFYKMT